MSGWQILVQQGPRAGQAFDLNKPVITIGREVGNDIILEDPQVSRHHVRLAQQGSGLVIEDLGSTNGTAVNGQRLIGTRPINRGDTIGLGDTVVLQVVESSVASETIVAGAPSQTAASYSPPPPPPPSFSAPPPPQTFSAPPPPSGFGAAPPAPPQKKGSRWWLWGCGCLVVLCLIVSAVGAYLYFNPGPINALFKLLGIEMQFQ
jgi:hypothetical protein